MTECYEIIREHANELKKCKLFSRMDGALDWACGDFRDLYMKCLVSYDRINLERRRINPDEDIDEVVSRFRQAMLENGASKGIDFSYYKILKRSIDE